MFSVQSMCRHGVLFMGTEAVTAGVGEAGSDPEPTVVSVSGEPVSGVLSRCHQDSSIGCWGEEEPTRLLLLGEGPV